MAAYRLTIRRLAAEAGFKSHNYLAIRLRDEKPFTLDDVDRICGHFGEDPEEFIHRALINHGERYWIESMPDYAWPVSEGDVNIQIAADETPGREEEAEASNEP